jgi:hypothetical protein
VLQYNKSDSRIREVRFVPSDEVAQRTKDKFIKVAATVDAEKSVENLTKEYVLGSQKCGFCPFRKECWPENDALKAYFQELPPKQWAKDLDRLPQVEQGPLRALFAEYEDLVSKGTKLDKIEHEIIKVLDRNKVYKVRLSKDRVYRVKRLKEGLVLRRDKE